VVVRRGDEWQGIHNSPDDVGTAAPIRAGGNMSPESKAAIFIVVVGVIGIILYAWAP